MKEKGLGNLLDEIIVENFQSLERYIHVQPDKGSSKDSSQSQSKKMFFNVLYSQMVKVKDIENSQRNREKHQVIYKEKFITLSRLLSRHCVGQEKKN